MSGIDNEICYQAPTLQMVMKWLEVLRLILLVLHDLLQLEKVLWQLLLKILQRFHWNFDEKLQQLF